MEPKLQDERPLINRHCLFISSGNSSRGKPRSHKRDLGHPLRGGTRLGQGQGPRNPTSAKRWQIWGTHHLFEAGKGGRYSAPDALRSGERLVRQLELGASPVPKGRMKVKAVQITGLVDPAALILLDK